MELPNIYAHTKQFKNDNNNLNITVQDIATDCKTGTGSRKEMWNEEGNTLKVANLINLVDRADIVGTKITKDHLPICRSGFVLLKILS